MKKLVSIIIVCIFVCTFLAGCQSQSEGEKTIGEKLAASFLDEAKKDAGAENITNVLASSELLTELNMVSVEVEEGYLNGFDGEVKGFSKGYVFSPMIGSIPFVGYVFETDDADALIAGLEAQGKLDWNVCTIADEMVVEKSGKYVFFVMAPKSFDDF